MLSSRIYGQFRIAVLLVSIAVLLAVFSVSPVSAQKLFPNAIEHKWGYMDSTGRQIIAPRYAFAAPFHEGYAWVVDTSNVSTGFGEDALNATESIYFGLQRSGTDYEWTMIDPNGKRVAHTERSKMKPIVVNGYTVLFDGDYFRGGWGLLDAKGNLALKGVYPDLEFVQDGRALATYEENGPKDYVDATGKQITKKHFNGAYSFHEGLAAARDEDQSAWGFLDTSGKWATKPKYKFEGSFSEGLARVMMDSLYGYIDTKGRLTIPYQFSFAEKFSGGLARVLSGGMYGYIDRSGKFVIPATIVSKESGAFEMDYHLYDFYEGLALVKTNDSIPKYGFRDTSGAIVIPATFEDAYTFENGLARAKKDGVWGYINRSGSFVWKAN